MSADLKKNNERRMFSLLVDNELLWKWGIVAAHEKRKKRDIILSLLVPYVNQRYAKIFNNNANDEGVEFNHADDSAVEQQDAQ